MGRRAINFDEKEAYTSSSREGNPGDDMDLAHKVDVTLLLLIFLSLILNSATTRRYAI